MPNSKLAIQAAFPKLRLDSFEITGNDDPDYNCIAWAAGDTSRNWWPLPPGIAVPPTGSFWPDGAANDDTLDAFIQAFGTLGYVPCDSPDLEPGFEKVAIYVKSDIPTHAARQLSNGRWTSKLGRSERIEHDFDALEGAIYGQIAQIMK